MRIATVIGRVTLSSRHPSLEGGKLLVVLPWTHETCKQPEKKDFSIVVYDELGASVGQNIAVSEGREAACPFDKPTPVDAYNAALIDGYFYKD